MTAPQRITAILNADGITAIQDAAVQPEMEVVYDTLQSRGQLTVRVKAPISNCGNPPMPCRLTASKSASARGWSGSRPPPGAG